jgi:hypothetical protein
MLMLCHVDALAAEMHAFKLQAQALLVAGFVPEFDFPTSAHYALPGQRTVRFPQHLRNLAME